MLPHLGGSFLPVANPSARGVFHGVSLAHGRGHFARSIFEAVAYMLRDNVETLGRLGVDCASVSSLGGAARSDLWLQIKADVLNRPLTTLECEETTCLGTAMLAAVGSDVHSNLEEAAQKMVRRSREFLPGPASEAYQAGYQHYSRLNQLIIPSFGG